LPEVQGLIITDPDSKEQQRAFLALLKILSGPPIKALMSPQVAGTVWKENNDAANAANEPGKFTAFCSYEWTSMPDNRNMHRNVFFRDCAKVPEMPYSALDSTHPVDLWKWMDTQRAAGNDLLAISHNANLSDGWMYPTDVDSLGRPIDAAWAESRVRNERLIEMKQLKGQSETHPLLSPNDEFASFAIWSVLLGLPPDSGLPGIDFEIVRATMSLKSAGLHIKFGYRDHVGGRSAPKHCLPVVRTQELYIGKRTIDRR
jgi:hypothetical protein